jgi:hypothetical protein
MTDGERARLEPVIPAAKPSGRPRNTVAGGYQRLRRLCHGGFPWREFSDSFGAKEIRAMPAAVKLREDFSAEALRALARRLKDVNQSRRFLSLAVVRDGKDRGEAARIGGMDRQTLRDWVHRFSAADPEGLFDNWTDGPKSRLSAEQLERTILRRNPATGLWTRGCETVFWVSSASGFSPEQWSVDPRALAYRERQPLRPRRNLRRGRVAYPQEPRHCRAVALLRLQSASRRPARKHQKREMARRARHQPVSRNNGAVLRTEQPWHAPRSKQPKRDDVSKKGLRTKSAAKCGT